MCNDIELISIPLISWVTLAMEGWAARWIILADGRIGCVACGATQLAGNASEEFEHVPGCRHCLGEVVQHPWLSLRDNLRRLPPDDTH